MSVYLAPFMTHSALNIGVNMQSGLEATQRCYLSYIVTMAASCAVFEIKRDIGRKNNFPYSFSFYLHDHLESLRIFSQNFNTNCASP